MKQQIMDVQHESDAILVPARTEREVPLESVKDASAFTRREGSRYFPLDFRLRRLVVDAVAQKYQTPADAAGTADAGLVCIGETRCERAWDSGDPALAAAAEHLRAVRGSTEGIVAVHLLGRGQPQPFLALGKRFAFLCTETAGDVTISYKDVRLTPDGLTMADRLQSEGPLLTYPLAEAFRSFFREFLLLRRTSLTNVRARHPLADAAYYLRRDYLDFLVDAAAAEGRLTAENAIRLEYMAREFHVGAGELTKSFEQAAAGGIPEKEMYDRLAHVLLKDVQGWQVFVLYQDILSLIVDADGGNCRPCLYRLLQRQALAGEAFVAACTEAIRCQRQAEQHIEAAVRSADADRRALLWPDARQWLRYEEEFRLKLMDIGVMTDDRTRGNARTTEEIPL